MEDSYPVPVLEAATDEIVVVDVDGSDERHVWLNKEIVGALFPTTGGRVQLWSPRSTAANRFAVGDGDRHAA